MFDKIEVLKEEILNDNISLLELDTQIFNMFEIEKDMFEEDLKCILKNTKYCFEYESYNIIIEFKLVFAHEYLIDSIIIPKLIYYEKI